MRAGRIAVLLIAAAMAVLVVRVAVVEAYLAGSPAKAAIVWPSHPAVILSAGLAEVGKAAREQRPVGEPLIERLVGTATRAPLAPEPFLVRGVDATLRGHVELAGRAFLAARDRDPRSVTARYFLADHYLRTGQSRRGLDEISALTRLVPGSPGEIGPYLAAYARNPAAAGEVRAMLRRNPELEPAVLGALSSDARDASLALYLWNGARSDQLKIWQNRLLDSLIAAGHYREARSAWSRFTGRPGSHLHRDTSGFVSTSQGPFGWTLASGSSGVAEARADGTLMVIYFGRDDIVLAGRVLMLGSGRYRLSMRVDGGWASARSLAWIVECMPSGKEAARLSPLQEGSAGLIQTSFEVPPGGCEAQRIELAATSAELPEQVQLRFADFRIEPEGAR